MNQFKLSLSKKMDVVSYLVDNLWRIVRWSRQLV